MTAKSSRSFEIIGAIAFLLALTIHVVANFFVKEMPQPGMSGQELQSYFESQLHNWNWVHSLRYMAIFSMCIFYSSLYFAVTRIEGRERSGWAIVGLIGGTLHIANLLISNGIERFAFTRLLELGANSEIFWSMFTLTRVLFEAEVLTWAVVVFGFSWAGASSRFPKWLAWLGCIGAACTLITVAIPEDILERIGVTIIFNTGPLICLLWFATAAAVLAFYVPEGSSERNN